MCSTPQSRPIETRLSRPTLALLLALVAGTSRTGAAAEIRVPQDHKTIQQGIDAAEDGDTVLVGAGTYKERIRLKPGITLKSDGDDAKGKLGLKRAEATIIDGTVPGANGPGVAMAEDSTLDGFSVTGVGEYDDALWKQHHATQGEQQSYEHIGEPGTAGIAVIGVTRCTVRNNIVHHIGYTGIAIMGTNGKRVSPHIVRNVTYRNMGGGIGAMKKSTATIAENVCFENFYAGIGHSDASPLVMDNTCYGNIRAGIGISEDSKPVVRGNKCYKNRRAGIGIRTGEATTPLVEYNECYDNDMAGIGVRADATPIIRHNRCYRNAAAGIGCRTKARPLIEHNECFENKMAGIGSRSSAEPVIRNNRCWENAMSGIGAEKSSRPVIVGNTCFGNTLAGIGVEEKAEAIIRGNKCYKNLRAGIGARKDARAIIDGNQCFENLMAGIGAEDGAQVIIRGNQCLKNDMAGIGTEKGAKALIVDNQCRENKQTGIGVREKASAVILENKCLENGTVAIGVRDRSKAHIAGNLLARTGGMPPMIAVRENSSVVVADNIIQGGGVAGVMIQGTATISGNQFQGNGPRKGPGPPNFAAWIQAGSSVSFFDNQTDGWRHALFATSAKKVRVTDNTAGNFLGTAIVVDKSKLPAHVFGNVAISDSDEDKVATVTGPQGVVGENSRRASSTRTGDDRRKAPLNRKAAVKTVPPRGTAPQARKPAGRKRSKPKNLATGSPAKTATLDLVAAKAAETASRRKAIDNVESIVARLNISSAQKSKVKAFTSESQWSEAVTAFKTTRQGEIHEHAHAIVPKTIPSLMRNFMPIYMSSKIRAQRGKKGRRGPPSGAEIAQIQKDARTKIEPLMRKTVMPALDKLTQERIAEMLRDEKVMTRMLADRIIKVNVLGDDGTKKFKSALDNAGYAATLTSGADVALNNRTTKMLKAIDLRKVVQSAGVGK